jgi:hypothetical protein
MDHLPHTRFWAKGGENTWCAGCKQIEEEDDEGRVTQAEVVGYGTEHAKSYAVGRADG